MGVKLIHCRERFVFETNDEKETLEKARNYFGESSTLLNKGLDYKISTKSAGSRFSRLKRGKNKKTGRVSSISIENWRRAQEYALRYDKKERYEPETFVRPDF